MFDFAQTGFKYALCKAFRMKAFWSQDERRQANLTNVLIFSRVYSWLLLPFSCGLCLALSGCVADVVSRSATLSLIASANSINLGSVPVGKTASATLSLVNKNPVAVNITQLNLTGQSFSVGSQIDLPVSIAAGSTYALHINFDPAAPGPAAGQLKITSDDPAGGPILIGVSGVGAVVQPASELSAILCSTGSLTGPGADVCTVTISAAAPSSGFKVNLSSNNAAVTVPATVTVPANAASAQFTANVTSVLTPQEATLSANANGASENFALQLNAYVPTLKISATSLAFGNVPLGTAATQSLTLTSAGTAPVTVSAATPIGTSFSVPGGAFALTLNPGQTATLSVQFDPTAAGVADSQLTITTDSNPSGATSISLTGTGTSSGSFSYAGSPLVSTLVPPNPATAISGDFFGTTIVHTATPFPAFPVSTLRFWDVDPWLTVEPSSGQFVWTGMDSLITMGKENGVSDFIYTFGDLPAWASTSPSEPCTGGDGPGTCAPPDMTAFDDFATHVVQRYCGTVKYYETWNEPNDPFYWSGTKAQLLTVAQHLYQVAKDPANCGCANGVCAPNGGANPNHVLMPSISRITSSNLTWLDSYLAGSGAQYPYADVASFHGYGAANPEDIVAEVQSLNQILAKHGLSDLQLWNTEASWGSITPVGQQQASWLMRYHVALAATGVSRFVWYAYDSCSWGVLWVGYCDNPQMPNESVTDGGEAYAAIESWLSGANLPSCRQYQNGLWACELQRAGGYEAWMLWSSTGTDISVPIPADFGLTVYRDWQNNVDTLPTELMVDQMPVLIENQDL
jgi:centrosomal CEP192-like protein/ASPM-SPD-2-Hydin domain-containing protein